MREKKVSQAFGGARGRSSSRETACGDAGRFIRSRDQSVPGRYTDKHFTHSNNRGLNIYIEKRHVTIWTIDSETTTRPAAAAAVVRSRVRRRRRRARGDERRAPPRASEPTSSPRAVGRHAGSERARTAQQEAQQREASEQTLVEATQDERRCGDERHVRRARAGGIEGWTGCGE